MVASQSGQADENDQDDNDGYQEDLILGNAEVDQEEDKEEAEEEVEVSQTDQELRDSIPNSEQVQSAEFHMNTFTILNQSRGPLESSGDAGR